MSNYTESNPNEIPIQSNEVALNGRIIAMETFVSDYFCYHDLHYMAKGFVDT